MHGLGEYQYLKNSRKGGRAIIESLKIILRLTSFEHKRFPEIEPNGLGWRHGDMENPSTIYWPLPGVTFQGLPSMAQLPNSSIPQRKNYKIRKKTLSFPREKLHCKFTINIFQRHNQEEAMKHNHLTWKRDVNIQGRSQRDTTRGKVLISWTALWL